MNFTKNTKNIDHNKFFGFAGIIIFMAAILLILYKAQIDPKLSEDITDTLKWTHKTNVESEVVLNGEYTYFEEEFLCTVPELKKISIYGKCEGVGRDSSISIAIKDVMSGEVVGERQAFIADVFGKKDYEKLLINTDKITDSYNKKYLLSVSVSDMDEGRLSLEANRLYGIVISSCGDAANKTNVIGHINFSDGEKLKVLFFFVGICILLLVALSYYLIVIREMSIEKVYMPLAIVMGIIILTVVPAGGAPDESWHLDTAYKYSNYLMGVGGTGNSETIYKRHCDAVRTDMLPNDIETGAYYQLMNTTLDKPEDTELIEVGFYDTSRQVTPINYLPAALGLSLGRILGLSAMMTYQLARFMSFICYCLMVLAALKLMPIAKEMMAMMSLLPIMLQQSASFSYDAVTIGSVFIFLALTLKLYYSEKRTWKQWTLYGILAAFLVVTKGAMYATFVLGIFAIRPDIKGVRKKIPKWVMAIAVVALLAIASFVFVIKFYPILYNLIISGSNTGAEEEHLTLGILIRYPKVTIKLLWNTLIMYGDKLIKGAFGGVLGWYNEQVPFWMVAIVIAGISLLNNVEGERELPVKMKISLVLASVLSSMIVILAMMLAETTVEDEAVGGLQGRYFIPQIMATLICIRSSFIRVSIRQKAGIIMTMLATYCIIIAEVFAQVLK